MVLLGLRTQTQNAAFLGPATTQNLVVKFDGEICGGVLVENASDDFPKQKKLENLLPNFAGSSPPISPKTSPTSLWKSLVLILGLRTQTQNAAFLERKGPERKLWPRGKSLNRKR